MNLVERVVNASHDFVSQYGVRAKHLYLGFDEITDLRQRLGEDYVCGYPEITEGSTFNGMEIVPVKRTSYLAVGP